MATLDELTVRIRADSTQLAAEMKKVEGVANQAGGRVGAAMEGANRSVLSLTAQFSALAGVLAGGKIVGAITSFEKIEASLRTVTGSASNAALAFDMIQKFAATTPYSVEQVAEAFIKLKALGLDPSEEALRSYGNTATAMGKNINQMIEAVADASTGEFERLKEFGIKTKDAGDSMVFTFQGIATSVKKDSADIEAYLRSIGDVQFGDAMAQQQGTLNAALSNMGDGFQNLAKTIGDAGLTDLLIGISNEIQSLTKVASESLPKFQLGFKAIVGGMVMPFVDDDMKQGIVDELRGNADELVAKTAPGKKYVAPKTKSSPFSGPSKSKKSQAAKAPKEPEDYDKDTDPLSELLDRYQQEAELARLSGRALAERRAEIEATTAAIKAGSLPSEEMVAQIKAQAGAAYEAQEAQEKLNKATEDAARFNADLKDRFSDTLSSIAFDFDNAADAARRFAETIAKMVLEKKVTGPLSDALGSLVDGIDFGKMLGFADGGRPPVGIPSLVGEEGPEVFVPDSAGTIVPNSKLGGQSITVNQTINLSPGLPETVFAAIQNARPAFREEAKAAVFQALQKGGSESRMLGKRS